MKRAGENMRKKENATYTVRYFCEPYEFLFYVQRFWAIIRVCLGTKVSSSSFFFQGSRRMKFLGKLRWCPMPAKGCSTASCMGESLCGQCQNRPPNLGERERVRPAGAQRQSDSFAKHLALTEPVIVVVGVPSRREAFGFAVRRHPFLNAACAVSHSPPSFTAASYCTGAELAGFPPYKRLWLWPVLQAGTDGFI